MDEIAIIYVPISDTVTDDTTINDTTINNITICMTIENVRKIERKRKYKRRYFGELRERNVCPICNSLDVAKRSTTCDYKCYSCKWIGKDVKKAMI